MSLFLLHKKVTSELFKFSVPAMRAFSMRGLAFLFLFMTLLCIGRRQRVKKLVSSSYMLRDVDSLLGRAQSKRTTSI